MKQFKLVTLIVNIMFCGIACSEMDFTSVAENPQFSAAVPGEDFPSENPPGLEPPSVETPPIVVLPPVDENPPVVNPPTDPPIFDNPSNEKNECDFGPDPVFDVCEKQIRCWLQQNYSGQANVDNMSVYFDDDSRQGTAWVPLLNCSSKKSAYMVFEIGSDLDCHIAHYYRRPDYISHVWQYGKCN